MCANREFSQSHRFFLVVFGTLTRLISCFGIAFKPEAVSPEEVN